ncbi:helix-turn-helix transcriptional regulator [Dactylosporangium vinaceum]|uniref:LuxR C-terminal-related transcriptional regulator n=1 Tax=Dactylosporangium vinaceum TaxID=53362 RepID=A0ABV5MH45_9ACTN|nr:helix-turn-helix transcriptional regulator [Dactylosporangium vinaceum]UAB94891.1 helix-turn-helix transcriptional regulator [Dactylosporangium vinaceum]
MLEYFGLDTTAEGVYRLLLAHPAWGVAELAAELQVGPDAVRAALDALFELSLLRRSAERESHLRAVSPAVGLQSLLAQQQADLERRTQRIAAGQAAMAAMVADYADNQPARASADATQVVGMDAILREIEELSGAARVELLSIMPGVQSPQNVEAARSNNAALIARNVTIRTAMQESARNDRDTLAYAQSLTDAGAEVRAAPLLPPRMLVFDRATAIVPIDPANTRDGVLRLTGRGVVTSLVALFEQVWTSAVPLGASRARDREGATPQERELLKLLGHGHTDESAAKRLGVSERTCRRMMADMMERLGARSRFEAGLLAARAGWL